MKCGVVVLNFGEPENAVDAEVVPFLERIFTTNARLEADTDPEAIRRRSRELAERRAPGLIEDYRAIGGSPLNRQARAQGDALGQALAEEGRDVAIYHGMQFTPPTIREAVERARADGVERLIGLPVYPLCGASTTVAALDAVERWARELEWDVDFRAITGWHRHPLYTELRADGIRTVCRDAGVDLADARNRLVFSAHGTPIRFVEEGNRYVDYVLESCRLVAEAAGVADYTIGYQNHANRGVEWTQPDVEAVIRSLDAEAVVVVPISFMHEQSETLAELDIDLKEEAEEAGLAFNRVPVPHDDPRFVRVLSDLVVPHLDGAEAARGGGAGADVPVQGRCRCRHGSFCLNQPAG
jgi:protoporphyrin/coproporphyrin ferrochelatase